MKSPIDVAVRVIDPSDGEEQRSAVRKKPRLGDCVRYALNALEGGCKIAPTVCLEGIPERRLECALGKVLSSNGQRREIVQRPLDCIPWASNNR